MGLRPQGSNPCLGIRRYRRKGRARFLSDEAYRQDCRHMRRLPLSRSPWSASSC